MVVGCIYCGLSLMMGMDGESYIAGCWVQVRMEEGVTVCRVILKGVVKVNVFSP